MRLAVVCPSWPPLPGGVADNTARWAEALVAHAGCEVVVLAGPGATGPDAGPLSVLPGRRDWGPRALVPAMRVLAPDVVVVQYVPHMYEPRGLSLGIARAVAALARDGRTVVTMAHELYYGRHEALRHQPVGLVQRALLRPLFGGSARVVFSTRDRCERMAAVFPRYASRFRVIPVGAGLLQPPAADPAAWRARHGLGQDEIVLLFQGGLHPSKQLGHVRLALDMLAEAGVAHRLVMIGGGVLDHPRALALGHVEPDEAATALLAADLALAPYDDGASGRRSSVMNALAAGLPVVSTIGANTDPALFSADALRLVSATDGRAFAESVLALARDAEARAHMGRAARALYDERFAWPVLARAWRAELDPLL